MIEAFRDLGEAACNHDEVVPQGLAEWLYN